MTNLFFYKHELSTRYKNYFTWNSNIKFWVLERVIQSFTQMMEDWNWVSSLLGKEIWIPSTVEFSELQQNSIPMEWMWKSTKESAEEFLF